MYKISIYRCAIYKKLVCQWVNKHSHKSHLIEASSKILYPSSSKGRTLMCTSFIIPACDGNVKHAALLMQSQWTKERNRLTAESISGLLTMSYNHHFIFQLTHTTLKNVELLKHFKIRKTAETCFGLQGNHCQGATDST